MRSGKKKRAEREEEKIEERGRERERETECERRINEGTQTRGEEDKHKNGIAHERKREQRGEGKRAATDAKAELKRAKSRRTRGEDQPDRGDATADNGRGATAEIRNEVDVVNTPISKRKVETAGRRDVEQ